MFFIKKFSVDKKHTRISIFKIRCNKIAVIMSLNLKNTLCYHKKRKARCLAVEKSMYLLVIDYSELWDYFESGGGAIPF